MEHYVSNVLKIKTFACPRCSERVSLKSSFFDILYGRLIVRTSCWNCTTSIILKLGNISDMITTEEDLRIEKEKKNDS